MVIVDAVRNLVAGERPGAVATVVSGGTGKAAIDSTGTVIAGELPNSIAADVAADAATLIEGGTSRTLDYGDQRVFIEAVVPRFHVVVVGAGHASQALAAIAGTLGYRVTIIDPRASLATRDRFPDADDLIVAWPHEVIGDIDLNPRTAVVLLSHDARFEDPVLPVVLASSAGYVGAMGSRKTHAARVERLLADGLPQEQLDRLHAPIGLDIGARTPPEMAVAILGEIMAARHAARGDELRGTPSAR